MDELELPKLNNGTPHKSQLQTEVEETLNSYQILLLVWMIVVMPQNDDEHAILRICMAGAYILAYFVFWLLQILIITEVIIGSFFLFIMYATYINGFVNIVLLIYFDPSTKWYFYALFGKYGRQISTTVTNRDATKPYCLESTV